MAQLLTWGATQSAGGVPGQLLNFDPKLAVAANEDGHLEIFAVATDGAVWHAWQVGNGPYTSTSPWSAWAAFPKPPSNFALGIYKIQAALNNQNCLEVFAVADDNTIWRIRQVVPNQNWASWESLGIPETNLSSGFGGYDLVLLQHFGNFWGLELFARNSETGAIFSKYENLANEWNTWIPDWIDLSLPSFTRPLPHAEAAINSLLAIAYDSTPGDSTELIALEPGGTILHRVRTGPPGAPGSVWENWSSPFEGPTGAPLNKLLFARPNIDQHYELVGMSGANVWHTWQDLPPGPNTWTGEWDNLGIPGQGVDACDMLINRNGQLDLVVLDAGFFPWERRGPADGWTQGWSAWGPLRPGQGLPQFALGKSVVIQKNGDGLLTFFGASYDGQVNGESVNYIPQLATPA